MFQTALKKRGRCERARERQRRQLAMPAAPGWLENMRLPNAVAIISALKNTARVRKPSITRVLKSLKMQLTVLYC